MPAKLAPTPGGKAPHSSGDCPAPGQELNVAVMLLPTFISLQSISSLLSLFLLLSMAGVLLAAKPKQNYPIQSGPLMLVFAASVMVLVRPEPTISLVFFAILAIIIYRVIASIRAKTIISSLIDGVGLYLIINVAAYSAGFRSATLAERVSTSLEFGGFVRVVFPLSTGLDAVPTIAALYVASIAFLIHQSGMIRRLFRIACTAAAMIVLVLGAARSSLIAAALLPSVAFLFPATVRWLAQASTLLASVFPLIFPAISTLLASILQPIVEMIPGRDSRAADTISLSSRDYIWRRSFEYWWDYIPDLPDRLFGFGQGGQIESGVWTVYGKAMSVVVRDPQKATLHSSFFQQLFDGGLVGWLLLTVGIFWASVRLSRNRREWGAECSAAIVAVTALMLSAIPTVSISPGLSHQLAFWVLCALVGVACQTPISHDREDRKSARAGLGNAA
jgi:hypothetical protein